ncbi:MAG: RluA family pseudouridine synthase [Spirochaetaceae bacterium]|jgi:23S rRNA pseudouridine1911/1915/1917 synthase|nr:RluA family pseudouridine synthase [Spirochaetaceae bacterium]
MDIGSRILYEDNHYLIINKLAGEIVQGDKTGDSPLTQAAADFLIKRDNKPGKAFIGLTHRLDRPTSGALILAKTSKGLSRMNELFRKGEVDKTYWAIVQGVLPAKEEEMTHWLFRDTRKNKSFAHTSPGEGRKQAKLRWKTLSASDRHSLVEIQLLTGRHHQIRAQFEAVGMVLRGDLKSGAKDSLPGGGISLHCRSMSFMHPIKQEQVVVTAPVPAGDSIWLHFQETQEA